MPEALAFIGGTGPEGRGLALRFAMAGYRVHIGSRSWERAEETVKKMRELFAGTDAVGQTNEDAASMADIVILTIPYAGLKATVPGLETMTRGKIIVSAIAPVEFPEGRPIALRVEAGSAAQEVQMLLPDAQVASAFQTVDARQLQNVDAPLDTDVLVCSDHPDVRRIVVELANHLPGVRALSAGRLASSRYVEEVTALLITLNRIYKVHSGVRITGVDR